MSHLTDEARYLHAAIFGRMPDDRIVDRYAAAHAALFPEEAQSPLLASVLGRSLDAEAVEASLRKRGPNLLTRKMQTLCYLVEVEPEYRRFFHATRASRLGAWFGIVAAGIRGAWKVRKGAYLVRRHGLD